MAEETIVGSRARNSVLGAISFLIAVASLGLIQGDLKFAPPLVGWVGVILFGALGVPVFASMAYRPPQLILRPDGLTFVTSFAQRQEIRWADVEDFFVWRPSGADMVGYRLRDPGRPELAHELGVVRALGGSWQGGAEQVVERLNRYRDAVLSAG
jgi:hypothetical protein